MESSKPGTTKNVAGRHLKEFYDLKKQQEWRKMHESLMHPNCKCVNNKVVVKINCNSVYEAYLVTCGYNQNWVLTSP